MSARKEREDGLLAADAREALGEALDASVEVDARRLVSMARAPAAAKRFRERHFAMPATGWLATAAGVGALAVAVSLAVRPEPPLEAFGPPPLVAQSGPVASAAEGDFAVIRTDNPDITILLFFDGQEQHEEEQHDE